jgi:hypothetical protein
MDKNDQDHKISIHIDKQQVFAPKAEMTGAEIRALASPPIGPDHDLYLEVPGKAEDHLVSDTETVKLKSGMHFYGAPGKVNPGAHDAAA